MIDFRLCLVTNRAYCRSTPGGSSDTRTLLGRAIATACRNGVRAVQLREKDLDARDLFDVASDLRRITTQYACTFLVNERVDVALASAADGVHGPELGFPPEAARKILGAAAVIGVSCHSLEAVQRAESSGADLAFYGPVFPTHSKSAPPMGLAALHEICARVVIPVFAIGGITPERSARCMEVRASGVAVVSALLGAKDIGASVRAFEEAMGHL